MKQKMSFHGLLRSRIDRFVHEVYALTRCLPKSELYGITSQLRRASLSIALNYIEGFARQRNLVHKNFLEISYGSLKESEYLIDFTYRERMIDAKSYESLIAQIDEIGAMLWSTMNNLEK